MKRISGGGLFSSRLMGKRLYSEAYPATLIVLVAATLLVAPLRSFLDLSNVALLYVLAVVLAGARYGRAVAIFAAVVGSLLFAYVFVPPHFSLAITDIQYLLSAFIMLIVALMVGHLTASLRSHAEIVEAQAAQTKSLYEFARQLTATRSSDAVIEAGLSFLAHAVGTDEARFVATGQFDSLDDPANRLPLHSGIERRRLTLHSADAQTAEGRVMAVLPLRTLDVEQGVIRFCIDSAQVSKAPRNRSFWKPSAR